jgi:hypothetical protein
LDVLGGVRYAGIEAELSWDLSGSGGALGRSGTLRDKVNLWDGIVGAKGSVTLDHEGRWFVPYYVDVGWGNDNWTWQAYTGIGYRFGWGDAILAYRYLQYDRTGSELVQELKLSGPLIGVAFRW